MRFSSSLKFWKQLGLIGLALNLSAFTAPQKDDLVELQGSVYGRSDSKFRSIDQNKVYVLKQGTRAVIADTKYFSETKNYGMCLQIQNATDLPSDHKCIWVYYDVKNPALRLYSGIVDQNVKKQIIEAWAKDPLKVTLQKTNSPEKAQAAETVREVKGIEEKKEASPKREAKAASSPAPVATSPAKAARAAKESRPSTDVDTAAAAAAAIRDVTEINSKQDKVMNPSNQCPDGKCQTKIEGYESCSKSNSYLEPALEKLLSQSEYSSFYNEDQKEIITGQCVKRNLTYFGYGGSRKNCTDSGASTRVSAKACVSKNYVDVTTKSFNLAAECFGSAVTSSEEVKKQFALSVFSLMAQESGMHANVMSYSGAAGAGQLTAMAIQDVNNHLRSIRGQLSLSNDPNCKKVMGKLFSKPMSPDRTCDQIGARNDNILKNMAYSFAYQQITYDILDQAFFRTRTYDHLFKGLSASELARLKFESAAWGHNTGPYGFKNMMSRNLRDYVRKGKSLKTAADVNQFLKDMSKYAPNRENANYHSNILAKMKTITTEPRTCLAN